MKLIEKKLKEDLTDIKVKEIVDDINNYRKSITNNSPLNKLSNWDNLYISIVKDLTDCQEIKHFMIEEFCIDVINTFKNLCKKEYKYYTNYSYLITHISPFWVSDQMYNREITSLISEYTSAYDDIYYAILKIYFSLFIEMPQIKRSMNELRKVNI